jgi:hypothetical protein
VIHFLKLTSGKKFLKNLEHKESAFFESEGERKHTIVFLSRAQIYEHVQL